MFKRKEICTERDQPGALRAPEACRKQRHHRSGHRLSRRLKNGNSLNAEIENWLSSQTTAESFPTSPRAVAKNDTDSVRNHFADIAAGQSASNSATSHTSS